MKRVYLVRMHVHANTGLLFLIMILDS